MNDSNDAPKKHLFTKHNYLLDLEHLHSLEKIAPLGDVEKFMSEMCILFLKQAPMGIQELDRALKNSDLKVTAHSCFRLRGICTSIGAKYMAELCQQLEQNARANDLKMSRIICDQLMDSFLVTRDQIQAYSSQLPKKQ